MPQSPSAARRARIWRGPWASSGAARTPGFRERTAPRRAPSKLCTHRPGFRKGTGPFRFMPPTRLSFMPTHDRLDVVHCAVSLGPPHRSRWPCSFTTCGKTLPVLAGVRACKHADVAQLAERDHAMVEATSSNLVIRSLRVCPRTPSPIRPGEAGRDVRGSSSSHVQRDTSSDGMLARRAQPK
jgi:hypothetical protein